MKQDRKQSGAGTKDSAGSREKSGKCLGTGGAKEQVVYLHAFRITQSSFFYPLHLFKPLFYPGAKL